MAFFNQTFFVYILTNKNKTVLYTGVTNDLTRRFSEHQNGVNRNSFTKKYNCFYLVYFEQFRSILKAIRREKVIKGWTRIKKTNLISSLYPDWKFLNDEFTGI